MLVVHREVVNIESETLEYIKKFKIKIENLHQQHVT